MARSVLTSSFFLLLLLLQSNFHFEALNDFYKPLSELKFSDVIISATICIANSFGLLFYNKSVKHTQVGVSVISTSSGIVSPILYGVLIYHETVTPTQYVNIALFVISLWFLENLNPKFFKLNVSKGISYALLARVFWSTWPLYAIGYGKVGVLWFCLILECSVLLMSIVVFCFSKNLSPLSSYKSGIISNKKWIVSLGVIGFCGVLLSIFAMKQHNSITNYAIVALLQPLISLIVSSVMLKERLTKWQYIGAVIVLLTMLLK
jgi:drug/metabolite transporter (DMT)-like permease